MISVPSPTTLAVAPGISYVYAIHGPLDTDLNKDTGALSTIMLFPSSIVKAVCWFVVTQVNGKVRVKGLESIYAFTSHTPLTSFT